MTINTSHKKQNNSIKLDLLDWVLKILACAQDYILSYLNYYGRRRIIKMFFGQLNNNSMIIM